MDAFVDLIEEGGGRVHFVHINAKPGEPSENYRATTPGRFTNAVFEGAGWRVMTEDGWTYYFPYRAKVQDIDVTVLTGFVDPAGHKYEMARDDSGDLLSIVTPSGKWLTLNTTPRTAFTELQDQTAAPCSTIQFQRTVSERARFGRPIRVLYLQRQK